MPELFAIPARPTVALPDRSVFRQLLRRGTVATALIFGIPALILLGLTLYLFRSAELASHSSDVITEVHELEKLALDMEVGVRGFQISGDERFLEPFEAAREPLASGLETLADRVADNPAQVASSAALKRELSAWLAFGKEAVAMRRSAPDKSASVETNLRGKALMDAVRARFDALLRHEYSVRIERRQRAHLLRVTVISGIALLGLVAMPFGILWQRRRMRDLSATYSESLAASERREAELRVTLRSIGDAVAATNAKGEVVFLNPVAEKLMGWTSAEAHGRDLAEVFEIFNEQTGGIAENPVTRVLRERVVVGLANHTVLRNRDGRETAIEDSAAPILDDEGEVRGVILVFHDVGEKRIAELALLASEARFRFLNQLGEATRSLTEANAILEVIAELLGKHLNVSRCAYADVADDGEGFTIQHDYADGCASTVGRYHLDLFGTRAAADMRAGRTLVLRDVDVELKPGEGASTFSAIDIKAIVCCPLVKDGTLRAMMAVHQTRSRNWTANEVALVEEVAERCWAIIARARAEAEVQERARLSELRLQIAALLTKPDPVDAILKGVCEALVRHLDGAFARVWTLNAREQMLEMRASAGMYTHLNGPHGRVPVGEFKIGRIAQRRTAHLTNDVAHDPNIGDPEWAKREGMVAFAGYPLLVESRMLGVIALFARHPLSLTVLGDLEPIAGTIAQWLERRASEAALGASEVLKTAIINTSLDGFILMDHEGRIADWNSAAEEIFSAKKEDVLGKSLGEVVVPERLRERHAQGIARYVATREARILGQRYELPAIRGDGSEFPCELSINHIPGTEPPLFGGFVRDITERQRAAADLTASAARLRQLADAMPQIVWMASPNGDAEYFNRRWYEFTGRGEGESLDDAWIRVLHPDDAERSVERWYSSVRTGEDYEIRYRFRDQSDGSYRWFLGRGLPVRDESGAIIRWFGTCTDIEDFVHAEAAAKDSRDEAERARVVAESASKAKDDFLAALSHELRTPLTPVLMIAATLREDERLPADAREQLGMMERNIALEARLIDDLLDLTRIAKGKLDLRLQACDAHSLIGLAVEIVRDDAQGKGIELKREFTAERSGLMADPARFQQVIWNLLRNAVKFTPRGGEIAIRTTDALSADGSAALHIEVRDSGIGIAPEALNAIFLPFEQAGLVNDHRFGGMGLGLAIARAIVDLHGGTIAARSEGSGHGATFVVELPGAVAPPSGVTPATELSSQPQLPGAPRQARVQVAPLRLLLVEDHEPTLQVLSRLLVRAGHRVLTASTVGDALKVAAGAKFDAVISDLGLPDGTGTDLMRELHSRYGLRGIALSGYGMEEDLARSREAGFALHLVKPVDFHQLEYALRELATAGAS